LTIVLEGGPTPQTVMNSLPAQEEVSVLFETALATQTVFTVKVYSGGELLDIFLANLPDQYASNLQPPVTDISVDQPKSFPLGLVLLVLGCLGLIVILVGFIVVLLMNRKNRLTKTVRRR
jgi:hypothetical protein